jgi:GNAT superfamily N-acetyltransferase
MDIDALQASAKQWGWPRTIYAGVMQRLFPTFEVCVVTQRPLSQTARHPELCHELSIKVVEEYELARASSDPQLELRRDFVVSAIQRGDVAVGVFESGRLIAFIWLALCPTPNGADVLVDFPPRHRYTYNAFTLPAYRGRRLQSALMAFVDEMALQSGCTHAINIIATHNYSSLASNRARGNPRVGYVAAVRLAGRVFTFRSPGARGVGVSFRPIRLSNNGS